MSRQAVRKHNGIKLPFALQRELGLEDGRENKQRRRPRGGNLVTDRKERRKALRGEKKQVGQQKGQRQNVRDYKLSDDGGDIDYEADPKVELEDRPQTVKTFQRVKNESAHSKPKSILKASKRSIPSPSPSTSETDRSRASSPGLVLDPNSRSFQQHAAEDNAEIAALERRLGLKGKHKTSLGDDMLDFVLDGLEGDDEGKKRKREGRDWLDQKRRKIVDEKSDDLDSNFSYSDVEDREESDDESGLDLEEENDSITGLDDDTEEELRGAPDNFANGSPSDHNNLDDFDGFESDESTRQPPHPIEKVRENPYVAPVAAGASSGKYLPPSLRKPTETETSSLDVLRRQSQGHLNKLSEANMLSILGEIEKLFRSNPRQDVTTVLIDLILTSFAIRSTLQNTFIILHAAFLAAVYKVMGTDFGAELLVRLIERFDQEHNREDAGKEALNLISLLANLFTFNVVSSNIIYDHVRLLLQEFSEINAELLLRVVRDCGPQLRSDDPSALRGIAQTMQDIAADLAKKGQTINVRTRVMMDTITDLKNNKMKSATNAAGPTGEHITRMRKALGSLKNRTLKAVEPLRITRDDIANSDRKGKWWLIGASWKGNEDKQPPSEMQSGFRDDERDERLEQEDLDLLALARQYRMNTDVRRSIFVAIMSANDCRDAQTRLVKLRLSTKQEQEIAKVLLRCARAEPAYNPYYALLAKNLCKDNKKIRIGFQFGLWDFFGRMGEKADDDESGDDDDDSAVEMHEIVNIARMYAYLICFGHMSIGVLKTLNIGFLKEQTTMFLEIMLISIMSQPKVDEDKLMNVFSKAADAPQIVKGLQYFVKKSIRNSDLIPKKDKEKVKDGCRIAETAFKLINSAEAE